jgi:hypothetical protein
MILVLLGSDHSANPHLVIGIGMQINKTRIHVVLFRDNLRQTEREILSYYRQFTKSQPEHEILWISPNPTVPTLKNSNKKNLKI